MAFDIGDGGLDLIGVPKARIRQPRRDPVDVAERHVGQNVRKDA